MAEVSRHISERLNVINVFHGVKLILYTVTGIYPKVEDFTRMLLIFFVVKTCSRLPAFTVSEKAKKQKLRNNKTKGNYDKIQGCARLEQVKRQRNRVDM